jgi:WD40 repeat protein
VEQAVWSPDHKYCASIDTSFKIGVWDVEEGMSLGEFTLPPGEWYASNCGLALSEGARLLAGASEQRAVIWNVRTGTKVADWTLDEAPGNRLAYLGDGKFRLVREEKDASEGVVYELEVGKEPQRTRRVLRPAREGQRQFVSSRLSWDGKRYLWYGPISPEPRRVEVYDTVTGEPIRRDDQDPSLKGERGGSISADGRWLYQDTGSGFRRHDLSGNEPDLDLTSMPKDFSSSAGLWAFGDDPDFPPADNLLLLKPTPDGQPWLALGNDDLSKPYLRQFSRDGHYLVYGSQSGVLTVIDLPALQAELGEFDRILQSK